MNAPITKGTPASTGGPLPLSTRAGNFTNVPLDLRQQLTPRAQKVTKGDLLLLTSGQLTPATQKLTVEDLSSLSKVFGEHHRLVSTMAATTNSGSGCCCCCTVACCCSCCAVSVTTPITEDVIGITYSL
jgi:hypothetical protein